MGRRRSSKGRSKATKTQKARQPTRGQKLKADLANLRLPRVRREAVGALLLIAGALTVLGLSDVSSGPVLDWWAMAVRRLVGWWAYPTALATAFVGLWLLWRELRERLPLSPAKVVALELLFLLLLTASHAPLVLRLGVDSAWLSAVQGEGGGYVGWALAVLLIEGLGALVGSALMLLLLLVTLYLLLSLSWADIKDWTHRQSRRLAAAYGRLQVALRGTPVVPQPEEPPWWEQEPDPAEAKQRKRKAKKTRPKKAKRRPQDGSLPPLDLLDPASPKAYGDTDIRRKTRIIEETLESFGVPAKVVEVNQGPTVTQFGLAPGYVERRGPNGQVHRQRVRVAKISGLAKDLALALAASPVRIEAPVPGRSVVGLEVPNDEVSLVSLRSIVESPEFTRVDSKLALALGEDVSGRPVVVDLDLMPHLLIAGATGSGKSVCMNSIISCLLLNNGPQDLQMLLVDPKMVELVGYNGIPHLLAPVVVDLEQVVGALAWVTRQMDERYQLFHQLGVRNLSEYNRRMKRRQDQDTLPVLAVMIDELADMMMVAPDEVERHICRIAQMGRATGIHLVIATQRPSVDVVTGLIKANFPARISFAVTSQIDSRVILDQGGAENLLGRGDMLFMSPQQSAPLRLQGCFVSDREIESLIGFWKDKAPPTEQATLFAPWTDFQEPGDTLLEEAIALAQGRERISTSFVQRKLHLGFPRASRLIEEMEAKGIVGPDEGGGRGRKVLLGKGIDFDEIDERLPGVEPG